MVFSLLFFKEVTQMVTVLAVGKVVRRKVIITKARTQQ